MGEMRWILVIAIGILVVGVLAIPSVMGDNKTWDGSSDSSWNNPANWTPYGVPTSSDNVSIPNVSNDPAILSHARAYYVEIQENAILTVNGSEYIFSAPNITQNLRINNTGTLDIGHDYSMTIATDILCFGTIDSGSTNTSEIRVKSDFILYSSSTFNNGHSTINFTGSGINYVVSSSGDSLYNLEIANPSCILRTLAGLDVDNSMYIYNGQFDTRAHTTEIIENLHVWDEIEMDNTADIITVGGYTKLYNGAYVHGDHGLWDLQDDLEVMDQAEVDFEGNHTIKFTGTNQINNWNHGDVGNVSFNNLTIDKSAGYVRFYDGFHVKKDMQIIEGSLYLRTDGENVEIGANYTIKDGGYVTQYRNTNTSITRILDVEDGGTLNIGFASTHGGTISAQSICVDGIITISDDGGNITYTDAFFVYPSGNVTLENGIIYGADGKLFKIFGEVSIKSDNTILDLYECGLAQNGSLWVDSDATPTIVVRLGFSRYPTHYNTSFHPGKSTLICKGSMNTIIDSYYTYWGVVVDKSSPNSFLIPTNRPFGFDPAGNNSFEIEAFLVIKTGGFHVINVTPIIGSAGSYEYNEREYTGFANIGGNVKITNSTANLTVNGPVTWGPNSTADVDNGTFYVNGSWEFMDGSNVNLTGNNTVWFVGSNYETAGYASIIYSNSSTSSFQDVIVDRDPNRHLCVTNWSTDSLCVDGNFTLQSENFFVSKTSMVIMGNLTISENRFGIYSGELPVEISNLTVHGDIDIISGGVLHVGDPSSGYSNSMTSVLICLHNLNIEEGDMRLYQGGSVHADSILVQDDIHYDLDVSETAEVLCTSNITVQSGGYIDMTPFGTSYLNSTNGSIHLRGMIGIFLDSSININKSLFLNGTLRSWQSGSIHIGDNWIANATGTFIPENSYVYFDRSSEMSRIAGTSTFNVIRINRSGNGGVWIDNMDLNCSDLDILDGEFDLNTWNVTVDGDLTITGSLRIDEFVTLKVLGDTEWKNGSSEEVSAGIIIAVGDWIMKSGSDLTFSGGLTKFIGGTSILRNYESNNHFHNVRIEKTGAWLNTSPDGPIRMNWLTINSSGDNSGLYLCTDLTVYYKIEVDDGILRVCNNVSLQHIYAAITSLEISSYGILEYYLPHPDDVAEIKMGVDSSGLINMSTNGTCWLNATDDISCISIHGGGILNMKNSNAFLFIREGLFLSSGTIDCTGYSPELHVGYTWDDWDGTFNPGQSTVFFDRTSSVLHFGTTSFYDIVINGSWVGIGANISCENIEIIKGELDLQEWNLTIYRDLTNNGSIEIDQNVTMDVRGNVTWGSSSSADVSAGIINVTGNWKIESGANMTFEGDSLVLFSGSSNSTIIWDGENCYFNNLTFNKDPGYESWLMGNEAMNVTDQLHVWEDNIFDLRASILEANYIQLDSRAELNMSLSGSVLYVWNTLRMIEPATFWMNNDGYASVTNFSSSANVWLGTDSNITVHNDFIQLTDTLYASTSTIYFDTTNETLLSTQSPFYNMIVDKGLVYNDATVVLYSDIIINGNLSIIDGTLYTKGSNDIYLRGNYFCDPGARLWMPGGSEKLILNGGKKQFIQTGGSDSSHNINTLIIDGYGTCGIFQNYSVRIYKNITVGDNTTFRFKGDDEDLYTGSDGVLNNGTIEIHCINGSMTTEFYAGSVITNNNHLYFVSESTTPLRLRSSSDGTQWHLLDNSANTSIPYVKHVRVSDSDASGGNPIYAAFGNNYDTSNNDTSNNDNWIFSYTMNITLSGTEGRKVILSVEQWGTAYDCNSSSNIMTWVDNGSYSELQDMVIVSPGEERYCTEDITAWTIDDDNVTTSVQFYRQWKPIITLNGTIENQTVTAYFDDFGSNFIQSGQHTTWSRWIDNGTSLSFSTETTGTPTRHTGEDFMAPPWTIVTSTLVRTIEYAGNIIPELHNGSMDPSIGDTTTWFNFTVEYWDANNDSPNYVYVNIDGTNYSMSKVNSSDSDFTDGVECYYRTKLSGGDHDYYFIANDTYSTNETSLETTGTIIPEFGLLSVLIIIAIITMAAVSYQRRYRA